MICPIPQAWREAKAPYFSRFLENSCGMAVNNFLFRIGWREGGAGRMRRPRQTIRPIPALVLPRRDARGSFSLGEKAGMRAVAKNISLYEDLQLADSHAVCLDFSITGGIAFKPDGNLVMASLEKLSLYSRLLQVFYYSTENYANIARRWRNTL